MTHFRSAASLLLLLVAPLVASSQSSLPVDMAAFRSSQTYIHFGQGKLFSMRSCRMLWTGVRFNAAVYDSADHMLFLKGSVFQSNSSYDPALGPMKMLIGKLVDGDSLPPSILIRETRSIGADGAFSERIVVQPGDVLCFTPAEIDDPLEERSIRSVSVALYETGRMAQ